MTQTELIARAEAVMPGGVLGSYAPDRDVRLVIERGSGSHVFDTEGRDFIDYVLGSGPLILGHGHPKVIAAVADQMVKGSQFYTLSEPAIILAERIVGAVPCAEAVKFTSTGAEATFEALRLARAFTGRDQIVRFEGSYHGHHDYGMVGKSAGIPRVIRDTVLTCPFNDLDATRTLLTPHLKDIAAIIVEPIQRSTPPRQGFLEGLRTLSSEIGCLLVFDEVVTGFRLAWGGAQEYFGVLPDLAAYGKIIGGGLPLAAVAGRRDVLELANPRHKTDQYVYFSGTLNGNPLAAAAGLATLSVLSEPGTYDQLARVGAQLRSGLQEVARSYELPLQVVGVGPMAGLLFAHGDPLDARTVKGSNVLLANRVETELAKRGVLCNLSAKLYTSLAHGQEDLERTFFAFSETLDRVSSHQPPSPGDTPL